MSIRELPEKIIGFKLGKSWPIIIGIQSLPDSIIMPFIQFLIVYIEIFFSRLFPGKILTHGRDHHLFPPVGMIAVDIDGALNAIKKKCAVKSKKVKPLTPSWIVSARPPVSRTMGRVPYLKL
jgi:hypothetical protein